jgi:hypothetical protein
MYLFLFGATAVACLVSGLIYFFLKKGAVSIVISMVAPLPLLFAYVFLIGDEFGYWAIALSIGICASLIGSAFGIFVVAQILKK